MRPASGSASGLVCSQKRDTLLRAYNLTRAVGREGVVTQRLCEVSGIRRRQVAFCKAGICQSFVLLGRKRIFVVPCQRYELPETIIGGQDSRARSEEHTSELQSRQYLVCRLLLEKKNK